MEGLDADDGIGIFRCGINKKVPFYTICGYHDMAGVTHHHECPDVPFEFFPFSWKLRRKKPTGDFATRLKSHKRLLPFKDWTAKQDSGLEQYTPKNCAAVQRVFTQLIDQLVKCGETASEDTKFAVFDEAMVKLNVLSARVPDLIESEERDQLCAELEMVAAAAGLDIEKDEDGESRITARRDW